MNKLSILSLITLSILVSACATSPAHVGASRPRSFINPGPETEQNNSYDKAEYITSFSQLRINGSKSPGVLGVMPRVGEIAIEEDDYRSTFSATSEISPLGSYSVQLQDSTVRTDITAIDKVALYRFTFPETKESHVMINPSHLLPSFRGGEIHIFDAKSIQGSAQYETETGINLKVFFCSQFSKPFRRRGTWKDSTLFDGKNRESIGQQGTLGAFAYFWTHEGESILMKMGVSTVSIEDARKNIEDEFPGWDFDNVQLETEQSWK